MIDDRYRFFGRLGSNRMISAPPELVFTVTDALDRRTEIQ
jgi:hypothetical protein